MKLKFKTQDFQTTAVNAVADLFTGQDKQIATFSIVDGDLLIDEQGKVQSEHGIGNALAVSQTDLLVNMQRTQKRNKLEKTNTLYPFNQTITENHRHFSIEMETGTGKTYVYTKTIFELNKRYGFTKFIIVVPSVAIREGVHKSLQITADHFGSQYDNVEHRYFIYNSSKLNDVRQFATSSNIEIMIINIDAFKKAENIINQAQDRLAGETAMTYIRDTNPIVIIDEPQSVDNTAKAKEAIASLNPMCVLRYSATHREKTNLLYSLTPVDAYQQGLVKQIVVSSNTVENAHNKPYIALKSVTQDGGFSAKLEIDVQGKNGAVKRTIVTAKTNDDLLALSKGRELYDGYQITGIDTAKGSEMVEFANTEVVTLDKPLGSVDDDTIKKAQIYRTIETHLDKELRYLSKGIKVLSLFFIDKVEKYRTPDGDKGTYAQMFEASYNELIAKDKYVPLRDRFTSNIEAMHNGYFSQDKKGVFKNTKGDTLADDDTYNTIMRDKEWLLSFDCPLRFIFSHSALKEGWDNPNVFQVCTLIEQKSVFTQRQKIGRGLRLCVDQQGNRIEDRNINVLHVMANESFAEFADSLQKEIEAETGVKFGVFQLSLLIGQTYEEEETITKTVTNEQAQEVIEILTEQGVIDDNGNLAPAMTADKIDLPSLPAPVQAIVKTVAQTNHPIAPATLTNTSYIETVVVEKEITYDDAVAIEEELISKKLIDKNGNMSKELKEQMAGNNLDLDNSHSQAKKVAIFGAIQRANHKLPVRNADKEVTVKLKKEVLHSPEFLAIWDKIKQKTTYRVNIDMKQLTEKSVADLKSMPRISKARITTETADLDIQAGGIVTQASGLRTLALDDDYEVLPDIVQLIATESLLKRSDVSRILIDSGRGEDFLNNPQAFTQQAMEIISRNRHNLATEGISYVKLAGQEYHACQLFEQEELLANLERNAVATGNSVYDHTIFDSGVENRFAQALDSDPDVKLFFKIPDRFKIDTPLGTYNPDWAVYLEHNGDNKLYFVLETKGTEILDELKSSERKKIECGVAHFQALGTDIEYPRQPVKKWADFKKNLA